LPALSNPRKRIVPSLFSKFSADNIVSKRDWSQEKIDIVLALSYELMVTLNCSSFVIEMLTIGSCL